jgi:glutathione S-transferase
LDAPERHHLVQAVLLLVGGAREVVLDGGVRMTESAAICQYLAARAALTPLSVEPDEAANDGHVMESCLKDVYVRSS